MLAGKKIVSTIDRNVMFKCIEEGNDSMKNTKLLWSLILCYSGLIVDASTPQEPQEAPLEGILRQQTIREILLPYVPARDIGRLSSVSRGLHKAVEPAIEPAMEKVAIWQSQILNAHDLDLKEQSKNYRDNQAFEDYVIQRIKDFATDNPGIWIELNLSRNNLGNDPAFLHNLLQAIVTTVHSLEIDLASLNLSDNQLASLPADLLDGLNNLRVLILDVNQLKSLPEHLFDGLNNLQLLYLAANRLESLPESPFEGLSNLKRLDLSYNRLGEIE